MILSAPAPVLADFLTRQMEALFPDRMATPVAPFVDPALERLETCLSGWRGTLVARDGRTAFDHFNTDQYAAFLYLFANTVFRMGGDRRLAARAYALNKALHALDLFYEVELPPVFMLVHPVGTVIGRARFLGRVCIYQQCTIGADVDGRYPTFGDGTVLYPASRVTGPVVTGDNCWIAAGASLRGGSVPSDTIVFGTDPSHAMRPASRRVADVFFR